jgi:succinate dehydrogenase/fumarate reductase flavoprotein subunit
LLKKQATEVAKEAVNTSVVEGEVILKNVAQLFKELYKDYQEVYMFPTQKRIKELSSAVDKFSVDQLLEKYKEVVAGNIDEVKHYIYILATCQNLLKKSKVVM